MCYFYTPMCVSPDSQPWQLTLTVKGPSHIHMQSVECVSLIEGPSHIYTKMAISEDKQKPVPQGNMPVLTLEIGELYIL